MEKSMPVKIYAKILMKHLVHFKLVKPSDAIKEKINLDLAYMENTSNVKKQKGSVLEWIPSQEL